MDREAIQQSQKDCMDTTKTTLSGPSLNSTHAEASGENPLPILPRLTPNPTLSSPMLTPSSTSPPPPLTPAPLLTTSHTVKTGTPSPFQHPLLPTPPKLTSTLSPNLRTYSRPVIPSPTGKTKTTSACAKSAPLISTAPTLTPLSASLTEASITSTSSSAFVTYSNLTPPHKTSAAVANGNARPTSVPMSNHITPFHTSTSPTGRQVPNVHGLASPGHIQANQSSSHDTQRISQQALLLGRDLKGSSHDQVLLRTQMLQSLTLRPPPPGTLTIPPSLRLKVPSSAPPPLSRPRTPLFPPIRPRPQPGAVTPSSHTTPSRHISVPPPTLYSAVRAMPLRPRLHSPNGHSVIPPRQSATLQPITAAPSRQMPLVNRQFTGVKNSNSAQATPTPRQTQPNSLSMGHSSSFKQSSSAARQLQIIALTSGHQSQLVNNSHAPASVPSMCPSLEPHATQLNDQSPQTLSTEVKPLFFTRSPSKTSPTLPSCPSLLFPSSLQPRTSHSTHNVRQSGEKEDPRPKERVTEDQIKIPDNGGKNKKKGGSTRQTEIQKETKNINEENQMVLGVTEKQQEEEIAPKSILDEGEMMEGIERYQAKQKEAWENYGNAMDRPDDQPAPIGSMHNTTLDLDQEPASFSKIAVPMPTLKVSEKPTELLSMSKDDLCENMSTQSDNQSVLSSLSSQSPPSSPLNNPLSTKIPVSLPAQSLPADSPWPSPCEPETNNKLEDVPNPNKSDEESEPLNQSHQDPWAQKVWPGGGKQVLTHLVEGFVIQEGLQPFPVVNRSSLLVQDQLRRPNDTNGINGTDGSPMNDTLEESEPQMESEGQALYDQKAAETNERETPVLHCQLCGKRGHAHNFMRSKRFCSTSCARGFNVRLTKRLRAFSAGSRPERRNSVLNRAESVPGKPLLLRLSRELWSAGRHSDAQEGPLYSVTNRERRKAARRARRASEPALTVSSPTLSSQSGPAQWSVEEVTNFIHTLPGGTQVAEEFRLQEIDGQALLLLTEDHLMTSMNIKLGPALKICAHINALKHH